MIRRNEHGVPQYSRGHAGRMLVALAAVIRLRRPTATSVANLTGLGKGNVDRLLLVDSRTQFGVNVVKNASVYRVGDWGPVLRPLGVEECLTLPVDRAGMKMDR